MVKAPLPKAWRQLPDPIKNVIVLAGGPQTTSFHLQTHLVDATSIGSSITTSLVNGYTVEVESPWGRFEGSGGSIESACASIASQIISLGYDL